MASNALASASRHQNPHSTLVVVARKNGKKVEALGASEEVARLLNTVLDDGVTFADLCKGGFLRGRGFAPFRHLLFVGVDGKLQDMEVIRRLGATIYLSLKSHKAGVGGVDLDSLGLGPNETVTAAGALTEGGALAAYEFDLYKTKKKDPEKEARETRVDLLPTQKSDAKAVGKAIADGKVLAECINLARTLGNTPGNLMTPALLANAAVKAAKGTKLKVTVWDRARIKRERMGGLLGVSLGSEVEPRFIIMEYHGAAKGKKPVYFVGKGLTFDSGGISIKPANGMEDMKFDKCGGCNVIGTMLAIARLGLKVNAVGLVPSTENMLGPMANKPGDILVARNGTTVQVDNTDAEGRLILMDALAYASERKPAAIFDAATLTGACVVALGNSFTGAFTRDEKVREQVNAAAERSGEWVWQMPIVDHHLDDMKGIYADLNNISSFKGAGSSTAAAFLEQFVGEGIPWAHFDIAGTAWHIGNRVNYCAKKGASGVMVRTFVELARDYV